MNRSLLLAAAALGVAGLSTSALGDEPRRIVKPTVTVEVIDDARHIEDIISNLSIERITGSGFVGFNIIVPSTPVNRIDSQAYSNKIVPIPRFNGYISILVIKRSCTTEIHQPNGVIPASGIDIHI